MQKLAKNIHAIVLTLAIAVAIAGFSTSEAVAQDVIVFSEGGSDSKTTAAFDTVGAIKISWRSLGGQFQISVVDPKDSSIIQASAPQTREGNDAPPMLGSMTMARPGQLQFQIKATGPWFVRVITAK
ncbi:MAG: hypothetical protein O3B37_11905 [Proteobacteria bacterium]|nr:hypothetical protein [Pseudomonadota bacterium]